MKYFAAFVFLLHSFIVIASDSDRTEVTAQLTIPAHTILVLGDSISAGYGIEQESGWVKLLSDRLLRRTPSYQVVNASISGETTIGGLTRLPDILKRYQPDIVIIELGGNDGLRGYPITKIHANLNKLVTLSQQANAQILLVGMMLPPNYGKRYTDAFYNSFSRVANEQDVLLLPFMLDGIAADPALMQQDGIHPKAEAQPQLMENIWSKLSTLIE